MKGHSGQPNTIEPSLKNGRHSIPPGREAKDEGLGRSETLHIEFNTRKVAADLIVDFSFPGRQDWLKAFRIKIKVINLAEFKSDQEKNWAGDYLLPLVRLAENTFEVAPTPRSPGYPPALRPEEKIYPHIYPATQQVLEQYDALHKGEDP